MYPLIQRQSNRPRAAIQSFTLAFGAKPSPGLQQFVCLCSRNTLFDSSTPFVSSTSGSLFCRPDRRVGLARLETKVDTHMGWTLLQSRKKKKRIRSLQVPDTTTTQQGGCGVRKKLELNHDGCREKRARKKKNNFTNWRRRLGANFPHFNTVPSLVLALAGGLDVVRVSTPVSPARDHRPLAATVSSTGPPSPTPPDTTWPSSGVSRLL